MKKTVQNLFTLVIAVLLIINTLPSMVYADEEIPEVKEEVQIKIEEIATEQKEVKEEKAEQIVEIKAAEKTENNEAAASLNAAKAVEEKVEEKVEVVIPERIKITYNFNNIIKTDGSRISKNASSTLSVGSGWNITQKKLDNQIPAKNFEVNGDKYVYTGNWIYDDGTPVSTPISFKNTGYAEDQVINLSPVYEITRKVQEETIPAETKPAETKPKLKKLKPSRLKLLSKKLKRLLRLSLKKHRNRTSSQSSSISAVSGRATVHNPAQWSTRPSARVHPLPWHSSSSRTSLVVTQLSAATVTLTLTPASGLMKTETSFPSRSSANMPT